MIGKQGFGDTGTFLYICPGNNYHNSSFLPLQDIDKQLNDLLDAGFESLQIPENPVRLYEPIHYTLETGGKQLRPRLLLLTAGLCGGDPETALPAAMAVEMLHNFTLIHDDIMDHAETRRGKSSIHVKWDEPTAILSGDVMFVLAMKQLSGVGSVAVDSGRMNTRLMQIFLEAVQTVCEGQAMDMAFQRKEDVTTAEYLQMIRAKTAALIQGSMKMGALIAGANEQTQKVCGDIGEHAGLAFQIQDDLLDVIADTHTFGKKAGGDIIEGKKTYLSILAFERADDTDRMILGQIIGNREAAEPEILRVIRIYHELGVIDEAVKALNQHYNKASQYLADFQDSEYRREINLLLDKLKVRDK